MHCSEVDPIQKPLFCPNGTEGYVTFMWNHVQLECHRFASGANPGCNRARRRQVSGKTAQAVCTLVRFAESRFPCRSHTSNEYVLKGINEALSMWAPTLQGGSCGGVSDIQEDFPTAHLDSSVGLGDCCPSRCSLWGIVCRNKHSSQVPCHGAAQGMRGSGPSLPSVSLLRGLLFCSKECWHPLRPA